MLQQKEVNLKRNLSLVISKLIINSISFPITCELEFRYDMATGTQDIYYPKESPLGYVDNGKQVMRQSTKYNHLLIFICNMLRFQ